MQWSVVAQRVGLRQWKGALEYRTRLAGNLLAVDLGCGMHAGHMGTAWSVAMSKDSQTIYTCSHDETIRQWGIMSGTMLKRVRAHTSTIYAVALSPDGNMLASVSADKSVKVSFVHSRGRCLM